MFWQSERENSGPGRTPGGTLTVPSSGAWQPLFRALAVLCCSTGQLPPPVAIQECFAPDSGGGHPFFATRCLLGCFLALTRHPVQQLSGENRHSRSASSQPGRETHWSNPRILQAFLLVCITGLFPVIMQRQTIKISLREHNAPWFVFCGCIVTTTTTPPV